MNKHEEEILLIEAYLENRLDTYESLKVQKRIQEDRDFANKVQDYRKILHSIEAMGEEDFKAELEEWEEDNPYVQPKTQWWPMAAVLIALAVVIGYWLIPSPTTTSQQELFAENFQPYDDIISARNLNGSEVLNLAFTYYNQGQFDSAAVNFSLYQKLNPNPSIAFYQGVSLLAAGNTKESLVIFEGLANDQGFLLREAAQWYWGLALLKEGQMDQCQQVMENIASSDGHDYQQSAQAILKEF